MIVACGHTITTNRQLKMKKCGVRLHDRPILEEQSCIGSGEC
jgi:hypothetical protein